MDSSTNQKKKTWIWGGLVLIVIVAMGIIGAVFFVKTPEQIFKTAIEELYQKADKLMDNATFSEMSSLKEKPFSVNGNVSFKTDMDLDGLEELAKYNYGFHVGMNLTEKLVDVRLSIKEENSDFLTANVAFQDGRSYVKLPELLDKTLDIGETDFDETFKFDIPEIQYDKNDIKALLKDTKEYFLKTVDQEKLTINKNVEDDYNGKTAQVEEIIYTLDEVTQRKTIESMINDMLASDDYLNRLAKISDTTIDEVKATLEEAKNEFTFEDEIQLIVSVEGIQKSIIEMDMIIGKEDAISYINYNDQQTLHFNDIVLILEEIKDDNIKLGYEYEDLKGILYFTSKKESDDEYAITVTATAIGKVNDQDVNFEITMNMSENLNDMSVSKMNVADSVDINSLSQEDALKLLTNLQAKIAGTPFESLMSYFMM